MRLWKEDNRGELSPSYSTSDASNLFLPSSLRCCCCCCWKSSIACNQGNGGSGGTCPPTTEDQVQPNRSLGSLQRGSDLDQPPPGWWKGSNDWATFPLTIEPLSGGNNEIMMMAIITTFIKILIMFTKINIDHNSIFISFTNYKLIFWGDLINTYYNEHIKRVACVFLRLAGLAPPGALMASSASSGTLTQS